jgi:YVTN family beta-propeller protein
VKPPLGDVTLRTLARRRRKNVAITSQPCLASPVEFRVLGPIEARDGGRELSLGGPKQRALLAFFLLHANEALSRDRLIDALWGEQPPSTAAHTLDSYVSRLRKLVGRDRLTRRPPGYLFRVDTGELDLDRFEQLAARAHEQLAGGDAVAAAAALRSALAVWRGPALADVLYEQSFSREAERLETRRLSVVEDRIDADLACGRSSELVGELEQLIREHPLRERLLGQLIITLYRSGQQARALEAFTAGKHRLAEELGLQPGPALQRLEQQILRHDPGLAPPSRPAPARQGPLTRRRAVAAGAVALAVIAGASVGVALSTRGSATSDVAADANQVVGLALGSAAPREAVTLDDAPPAMAAGHGSLWLADTNAAAVVRVDPANATVVDRIPVGINAGALAVGGGSVWAAGVPGDKVVRIDPATGRVTQTVSLGGARLSALAFGAGGLWVADVTDDSLLQVDPAGGSVRRTLTLSVNPSALAISANSIWVADYDQGTVTEVEPRRGNVLATVRVGTGPTALTAGSGAVWAANALDSTVSRIDTGTASVTATVPVGSGPAAIVAAGGFVWVANQYASTVSRIDPGRNAVVGATRVGGSPTALAALADRLWVGTRSLSRHRGGTLTLLHTRPITIDPALQVDLLPLVSDGLTHDGLVTYNHVAGPAGIRLVPDLAVSIPLATDGGRSYVFRVRPGIRYSDGRLVRAADFRRGIERIFRLSSENGQYFSRLVGADFCGPSACDLSGGIVTDERARTVTFHLRAPDPDLLNALANAAIGTPVPVGTPNVDAGHTPIPGTGPYRIARASEHEIRYIRNPYFREWSHAARPDGNPDVIVMRFGLSPGQAVREIQAGRADWAADNIPAALLPGLRLRHPRQLHRYAIPTTDFFQFNTTLAPFDDVRVRRALNFALDRRAIVRFYGGTDVATPTCQILAPGVAGYRRYCPYTRNPKPTGVWRAPNLAEAKRLVAASGTRGASITVWGWTDDPTITTDVPKYAARVLRRLGYHTRVHLVPHAVLDRPLPPGIFTTIQLAPAGWGDTPNGYFTTWFSCSGVNSHGWFCDPAIDRQMRRAQWLNGTRPRSAAAIWARIDRELVDRAAWVPLINEGGVDFVSKRVRNYQAHPYWGLLADQLWLR